MTSLRRPMISLTAATGLAEAIEAGGADVERLLRAFHLDRERLVNPHGFMPTADFAALLEEAAAVTGDDCFGLHFGAGFDPRDIGPLAYVILHSPSIGVAIANAARYLRVHNQGAHVAYVREPPVAYLQHVIVGAPPRAAATARGVQPGGGAAHRAPDGGQHVVAAGGAVRAQDAG